MGLEMEAVGLPCWEEVPSPAATPGAREEGSRPISLRAPPRVHREAEAAGRKSSERLSADEKLRRNAEGAGVLPLAT